MAQWQVVTSRYSHRMNDDQPQSQTIQADLFELVGSGEGDVLFLNNDNTRVAYVRQVQSVTLQVDN